MLTLTKLKEKALFEYVHAEILLSKSSIDIQRNNSKSYFSNQIKMFILHI